MQSVISFRNSASGSGCASARYARLRDLDLRTRIFKYPCSFLILNPAFDALPAPMRDSILTGTDQDPQFAKIAAADRQAILEIFRETKPNLPEVWRAEK